VLGGLLRKKAVFEAAMATRGPAVEKKEGKEKTVYERSRNGFLLDFSAGEGEREKEKGGWGQKAQHFNPQDPFVPFRRF